MVPNCRAISLAMRRPHSRALQTFQQPIIIISRGRGPTPVAFRWRTRITSGGPTRTAAPRGKICVVLDFVRLRARLNQTLTQDNSALEYNGIRCHQIFSINYGVVDYVAWDEHRANAERLPNPIKYAYLKSSKYRDDRELRISLSAIGMGHFVLNDGSEMGFPSSLHFGFDFRAALADGTITEFVPGPDCDKDFLRAELSKLRIVPVANEQKWTIDDGSR